MNPIAFGSLPSGESIDAYTLANAAGSSVQVITYGGIVTSLRVPDRSGRREDVVLGFDSLAPYLARHPYFGAITGRIAGRIAGGRLQVDGRTYALACNDGANHLHGGWVGLDRRVWSAQPLVNPDGDAALRLTYRSPDGEECYPGNVEIAVTYTLTRGNAFVVETRAVADRLTPLSLAHHSYFNLAGEGRGTISDHQVQICAKAFVPASDGMVPLGRRETVAGRGNDFTRPQRLGDALPDLFRAHGDLYLLRSAGSPPAREPTLAARVCEPGSGRVLEVFTDESCLQFYSGSALDGSCVGKSGQAYGPHSGFCLECQGYPESSDRTEFGDIRVRPGEVQCRRTIYAFSTD